MDNLLSLLFTYVIYPIYALWVRLTRPANYFVDRASLEYTIKGRPERGEAIAEPWLGEKKFWEWYKTPCLNFLASFNHPDDYRSSPTPRCVERAISRVKYYFDGKPYKFICARSEHEWPPPEPTGVSFHVPLVEVILCDADGKPVRDITSKIKKYAGPRGDFHGEEVYIRDLLCYRIDTLKSEFPLLRLQNSLGLKKTLSTLDAVTTDLKIP